MNSKMSSAAVKRMRSRPLSPPPPLRVASVRDEYDRRRIPIEGRRKTREWHEHQARVRAFQESCKRIDEYLARGNAYTMANSERYITGYTVVVINF